MPVSTDCERQFSAAGLMVVPLRNRLEASTIGITQTVRPSSQEGLICSRNHIVVVNEEPGGVFSSIKKIESCGSPCSGSGVSISQYTDMVISVRFF